MCGRDRRQSGREPRRAGLARLDGHERDARVAEHEEQHAEDDHHGQRREDADPDGDGKSRRHCGKRRQTGKRRMRHARSDRERLDLSCRQELSYCAQRNERYLHIALDQVLDLRAVGLAEDEDGNPIPQRLADVIDRDA